MDNWCLYMGPGSEHPFSIDSARYDSGATNGCSHERKACVESGCSRLSRATDSLSGGVSAESVGDGEGHGAAATPELVPRKSRGEYRALRAARARGLASDAEAPVPRAKSHTCDASERNVSVPCCLCGSVIRGVVFAAANGGDAHMTCASSQLREITRLTEEALQRRRLKREASELHAQRWALRTDAAKNHG